MLKGHFYYVLLTAQITVLGSKCVFNNQDLQKFQSIEYLSATLSCGSQ